MHDALPKLLIELRDDADVAAITDRIRIREPAAEVRHPDTGVVMKKADAQPGTADDPYFAFVVLARLDAPPMTRAPVQRPRVAVRCYGRTSTEAYALYAACYGALHRLSPRVHGSGANSVGIYLSKDDTGPTQDRDPSTQQPLETFIVDLFATTQAVTA